MIMHVNIFIIPNVSLLSSLHIMFGMMQMIGVEL